MTNLYSNINHLHNDVNNLYNKNVNSLYMDESSSDVTLCTTIKVGEEHIFTLNVANANATFQACRLPANTEFAIHMTQNNTYQLKLKVSNITKDILPGTKLGSIQQAKYTVESLPVRLKTMNTLYNICNISVGNQSIPTVTTFKDILQAWNTVDCIRSHKKIVFQSSDEPTTISLSRKEKVYSIQVDPNTLNQFNIKIQANKLTKKDGSQCIIIHLFGSKGSVIPKGTVIAKVCYEPLNHTNDDIHVIPASDVDQLKYQKPLVSREETIRIPRIQTKREKVTATRQKKGSIRVLTSDPTEPMPLTQNSYTVKCFIHNKHITALIDSGSCGTVISLKTLTKIHPSWRYEIQPTLASFTAVQGSPLTVVGEINLNVDIDQWFGNLKFIVIEDLQEDIILGQNFLITYANEIKFQSHKMKMRNGIEVTLHTQGRPIHIKQAVAAVNTSLKIPAGIYKFLAQYKWT